MTALVYQATNKINGKRYVGVTDKSRLSSRKSEHRRDAKNFRSKSPFHAAIRKYGFLAFDWKILWTFANADAAFLMEEDIIAKETPEYNLSLGGRAGTRDSLSRAIKCLTDGEIHKSISLASSFYGLSRSRIGQLCRDGCATKSGLRFTYIQDPRCKKGRARGTKPIICINDGAKYISAGAAAGAYGVDKTSIGGVCRGKAKSVRGLVFRFCSDDDLDISEIDIINVGRSRPHMRPVVCCTDGIRYDSIGAAAKAYGVGLSAISSVLRGKAETSASGRTFRYADDPCASEIIPANLSRVHDKRVLCENDGMEYPSASAAAKRYEIAFQTVSRLALNGQVSRNGLRFRYL